MLRQSATLLVATALLWPTSARAQDDNQDEVSVEAVVALSVEDREPVDAGTSFPADVGQVVGWTRVAGAAGTTIQHVWRHQDHEFVVDVNIGGSPWRVWTSKTIPPEWDGEWTFEVRDAEGNVVSSTTFTGGEG